MLKLLAQVATEKRNELKAAGGDPDKNTYLWTTSAPDLFRLVEDAARTYAVDTTGVFIESRFALAMDVGGRLLKGSPELPDLPDLHVV